jgi:hypothetical protein
MDLVRAGSVLDLGGFSIPRRSRVAQCRFSRAAADGVVADWNVVAAEFNRVARGESTSQKP